MTEDIRWKQRLNNYLRALQSLNRAVALSEQRDLSELEELGLIHSFEFTHELAWKVFKDYLEAQGIVGVIGSKNATREAFKNGLIVDGEAWMGMIKARNLTSHTYTTGVAAGIVSDILQRFYPALAAMAETFSALSSRAEIFRRGDEIVLRERPLNATAIFDALAALPSDFMEGGRDDPPPQKREVF